jgi:hypothetical protein
MLNDIKANPAVYTNKNHDLYVEEAGYPECGAEEWYVN